MTPPLHTLPPRPQPVDSAVEDDRLLALEGVRALLRLVGEDPDRDGLMDTPQRFVRAWLELAGGGSDDPAVLLAKTFEDVEADEMIAVGPITFTSVCEHHLLPFTGTAWVAYKPEAGDKIVGLSKLARLVKTLAARPQVQERLTGQVTAAITEHLSGNAACIIEAQHACMSLRGVKDSDARMVTSSLRGLFREDPRARGEFLALTGRSPG